MLYNEEMCERVIAVLSGGGLLEDAARELSVDTDTIVLWRSSFPMFDAAVEAGLIFSEEWWTEEGKRNLHNPSYDGERWYRVMHEHFGRKE